MNLLELTSAIYNTVKENRNDFSQDTISETGYFCGRLDMDEASIRVVKKTTEGKKNPAYTVAVVRDGAEAFEFSGKFARRAYKVLTTEPKQRTKKEVSSEVIDSVAAALGL